MNDIGGGKKGRHLVKRLALVTGLAVLIIACAWGAATLVKSLGGNTPPDPGTIQTLPSGPNVSGGGTETSSETVTDITTTPPPPPPPERKKGVYTFLIAGMDKGGILSDVVMVVYFDTENNKLNVLNIPRDTYCKNLDTNGSGNINLAYSRGGRERLKTEVMNLIGYKPDFYIQVGLDGAEAILNKAGPIRYNVPFAMDDDDPAQDFHIHLQPGWQNLSGKDALALMRYRKDNSDIWRIKNRSEFLKAMAEQLLSTSTAIKAVELAGVIFDNVEAENFTLENLTWFAEQALRLKGADIYFDTLRGSFREGSPHWHPNREKILGQVNAYFNPLTKDITTIDVAD